MNMDVCVFCSEPGCIDGTVRHGIECPFTTNLWPVDDEALRRDTDCAACATRFVAGDFCAQIEDPNHPLAQQVAEMWASDSVSFTVCVPCAAMGTEIPHDWSEPAGGAQ